MDEFPPMQELADITMYCQTYADGYVKDSARTVIRWMNTLDPQPNEPHYYSPIAAEQGGSGFFQPSTESQPRELTPEPNPKVAAPWLSRSNKGARITHDVTGSRIYDVSGRDVPPGGACRE